MVKKNLTNTWESESRKHWRRQIFRGIPTDKIPHKINSSALLWQSENQPLNYSKTVNHLWKGLTNLPESPAPKLVDRPHSLTSVSSSAASRHSNPVVAACPLSTWNSSWHHLPLELEFPGPLGGSMNGFRDVDKSLGFNIKLEFIT